MKIEDWGDAYVHDCPGCDMPHQIPKRGNWKFNEDFEKPTFSPSVRHQWMFGPEREPKCCHYFIREGRIEFCGDCTHDLAGQTVGLPDMENSDADDPHGEVDWGQPEGKEEW